MGRKIVSLAVGAVVLLGPVHLAAAQTSADYPPRVPSTTTPTTTPATTVTTLATRVADVLLERDPPAAVASSDRLPVTGGDIAVLALIGAGAAGLGVVLVRRSRHRAT